ncbi:MAG: PAS domain-containing protein, partial [Bacteroidota bacterium]
MSDEEKNFSGYREKAENYFKRNAPDNEFLRSQDKDRIIHELRVHQIELELQNEELRNTQLELERTRNEYSDLFKNAPVGYLIITDQGLIIRANNTASAYFDLPVKKIEDQFITQFIHRDSQDDFHHFRLKMISGESKTRAEITLRINNKNFYSLFEGSAIARLPREKQFYRLVISDINRIKTLERETISGRANYSAIFSMAHDPMFVISNTGIILDCNITAAALFEKSPHEFIGDNIASYFAEGSPIQLKDFLIENSGELSEADFRGSKGESIRLEISSTGIEFHEQDAVLLVCRDLRERISYHR